MGLFRKSKPIQPAREPSSGFDAIDRSIAAHQQHAGAAADASHAPDMHRAQDVLHTRELYWHNVLREMLNGLSVLSQQKPELFDGRFAVLTNGGERIAIRAIFPLFACSIPGTPWEREASMAVQCTVFRIITTEGEVFTLPVHEIRALHSLTQELVEQLQKIAEEQAAVESQQSAQEIDEQNEPARPFGLAAFTSLPRRLVPPPGPDYPEVFE